MLDFMSCPCQGVSSEEDADQPSNTKTRGMCGQFVWACPREYPSDADVRRKRCLLIPEDLSKDALGKTFKLALSQANQLVNMDRIHIFGEPHKKYNPSTGLRARHYHIVFRSKVTFAHLQVAKTLRKHGIHGHFSFNLVGYQAYLRYCLKPSASKLAADLDTQPWSWPDTVSVQDLLKICDQPCPQMEARADGVAKRGRKRSLLSFSEVTDAFVEGGVKCARDAWMLAKARKVAGDDTLFNTLGSQDVSALVAKVISAWHCDSMIMDTLRMSAEFPLDQFVPLDQIHPGLSEWLTNGHKTVSLIMSGRGGLGKTELACALMSRVCKGHGFHFLNRLDRLRDVLFISGQGLLVDEACLRERCVDDAKAILDVAKSRDVVCRNKDGRIPQATPRIFSTNWSWDQFFPPDAGKADHEFAIRRRSLWVSVDKDLRQKPQEEEEKAEDWGEEEEDEEDVLGHGGRLE
jgi:hypothetical protein